MRLNRREKSLCIGHRSVAPARASSDLHGHLSGAAVVGSTEDSCDRPVIVGHSMGALVAMQYLRTRGTANVAALCVVDQSPCIVTSRGWSLGLYGRFARRRSARFVAQLRADFGETVLRMLALGLNARAREEHLLNASHIVRARRALRERDGSALAHLFASLARADFRSLVPTLDCPVLVVLGGKSHLFPSREHADYWRSAARSARVETDGAADHFPHRTHAERLVADLRAPVATATDESEPGTERPDAGAHAKRERPAAAPAREGAP